jgi:nucleoside-diphosphate-sugar epimerase
MKKAAFLFGGSGYIAHFLLKAFIASNKFEIYYVYDLKPLLGFESEIASGLVVFKLQDVRNSIEISNLDIIIQDSWVFNFAAVHREPGHEQNEYFDTNINGAKNVNTFLESTGIKNLFFTSSIAPYGRSLEQRSEKSPLYPETPYGISKAISELIHQNWVNLENCRRLVIVRPSVIYGPNDPGNIYRMIKAIKRGVFIIPGKGDVIKAYGYVYGLVESIFFVMEKDENIIVYNYAENPIESLKEMTKIVKKQFNYKLPILSVPINFLVIAAFFIVNIFKVFGKKSDIHPVRVKKAGFPTNIEPQYLIENGFNFKYSFEKSLIHWKGISPIDFKNK